MDRSGARESDRVSGLPGQQRLLDCQREGLARGRLAAVGGLGSTGGNRRSCGCAGNQGVVVAITWQCWHRTGSQYRCNPVPVRRWMRIRYRLRARQRALLGAWAGCRTKRNRPMSDGAKHRSTRCSCGAESAPASRDRQDARAWAMGNLLRGLALGQPLLQLRPLGCRAIVVARRSARQARYRLGGL